MPILGRSGCAMHAKPHTTARRRRATWNWHCASPARPAAAQRRCCCSRMATRAAASPRIPKTCSKPWAPSASALMSSASGWPGCSRGSAIALYGAAMTAATYERLDRLAALVLQAGYPTILDATFLRRAQRDAARQVAAQQGVAALALHFDAPANVLRRRLHERGARGVRRVGRRCQGAGRAAADGPAAAGRRSRGGVRVPRRGRAGRWPPASRPDAAAAAAQQCSTAAPLRRPVRRSSRAWLASASA